MLVIYDVYTMYDIIELENLRFRPSTCKQEASVFKHFHSGERFWNDVFSLIVFTGYVWAEGQTKGKCLRFQTKTDTCGRGIIAKPNLFLKQVPVYPVPYQSPVPPSTSPKPKSPVAPADDIQLPPIGFNRKTQPNGYWTPPPKYDDIFARRSRPPSSPQKVPKNSLAHLLCLLWSLKKHYSRTFLVFKLIVIFRLNLGYEICIGNSMICSDIWHKYHEWYFEIVIRNFTSR